MNLFSFIPPELYSYIYTLLICLLCFVTAIGYTFTKGQLIFKKRTTYDINAILLALFVIMFLGPRPVHPAFVDTGYYVFGYINKINSYASIDLSTEWLWNNFEFFCKSLGLSPQEFLLVVEFFYVGSMFAVCWRLMPNNKWVALLFFLSAFSFYGYGINGIRNGMACHIVLLGISFLRDRGYWYILAFLLFFIAYSIHRSTLVPIVCAVVSFFLKESTNPALVFWFVCIVLSSLLGNFFNNIIQSFDLFENKLDYFSDASFSDVASFSHTGFRWDFLIYSAMPVYMIWYVTHKRNFLDHMYNIIANTYLLANSFWILVIRASYSNRFAYLSWFLYPLVIAYPLIRMNIWEKQDTNTAVILFLYAGFTLFMNVVYYG